MGEHFTSPSPPPPRPLEKKERKISEVKFNFTLTGLPDLEKVIVMPFVGKADEIDLSNIPNRYLPSVMLSH